MPEIIPVLVDEAKKEERSLPVVFDRVLLSSNRGSYTILWHLTFKQTFLDMDQLLPNSLNLIADPWKRA